MKRSYEMVVILEEEIKPDSEGEKTGAIKKLLADLGAENISFKDWGKKEFTFPIKKRNSGKYQLFEFSLESDKVSSLKQKLQLNETIIRFLLTVSEDKKIYPKAKKTAKKKE